MKKSGCLLKKRSFRRFPSLVGTPFSSNASRSVGRISAVLSPIWLKFWPKVGLASLLDCYSMKKSGYLLKKQSFRCFRSQPSLNWAGLAEWKFFCFFQHLTQDLLWPVPAPSIFWRIGLFHSQLLWFWKKKDCGQYLGRFKPDLAQILVAGSPDPSPDLLFNATKR